MSYSIPLSAISLNSSGQLVFSVPIASGAVSSVALTVPSFLSVSGSPITSTGTLAVSLSGTALPIANGGTNSVVALSNGKIMSSVSGSIVEASISTSNVFLADGTVSATGAFSLGNNQVHNVTDPTSAQDAATKNYVDNAVNGLDWKQAALLATAAALPTYIYSSGVITMVATGTVSVDGSVLALGNRILVKNETSTNQPYNGIYNVTTAGAVGVALVLTRSTDYNSVADIQPGDAIYIQTGTVNATTTWVQTQTITSVGGVGQNIIFVQSSGPGAIVINGTANQIIANTAGTTTTLSTPQSIATTSSPTFAALTLTSPLAVANGGTGLATLTAHDVLVGNGTGNVTLISPSTAGFVLTSNGTSADPTFQASSGGVTSIAGTANQVIASASTGAVTLSLPQNIATTSNVNFASVGVGIAGVQAAILNLFNSGNGNAITLTASGGASNYTIQLPNLQGGANTTLLNDGTGSLSWSGFVSSVTGTTNEIIASSSIGAITLSLPQAIAITSSPTFAAETLTSTTNQFILGTTNTTTISSTAPSASRTYTIPDAGSAANFILDHGNYTLSGTWTNATLVTPALGTPSALVLTNATGLPVAGGGTGDASFTAYSVITGGTTSTGALQNVSGVGTMGQVLTSNGASALPTWQTASGSGTVNSGTLGQTTYYASSTNAVSGNPGLTTDGSTTISVGQGGIGITDSVINVNSNSSALALIYLKNNGTIAGTLGGSTGQGAGLDAVSNLFLSIGGISVFTASAATANVAGVFSVSSSSIFNTLNLTGTASSGAGANLNMASTGGANLTASILLDARTGQQQALKISTSAISGVTIQGTATNDSATAGNVGEYVKSTVGNVAAPTTNTWGDFTSISLSAGDWDVTLNSSINISGGPSITEQQFGIGTISGNNSPGANQLEDFVDTEQGFKIPMFVKKRVSFTTTTTVYAKANIVWTGGSVNVLGSIQARRMR